MKARPANACDPRELLLLVTIVGAPCSQALSFWDEGLTSDQVTQRLLDIVEPHEPTAAEAFAAAECAGPKQ